MHYTSKEVYEFISKTTNDPIVERKKCEISWQEFPIYKSDLEFYDKISPIFNWKKYKIPTPRLCPEERERRRMMFRNERKLYRRKCDATWEDIISIYSPDKLYKIFKQEFWWSDSRNPLDYWQGFDFWKSFTEQFFILNNNVPKISIMNDDWLWTSENCAYCQDFSLWKNCYMVTASWHIKNSLHSDCVLDSEDLVDCTMLNNKCNNVYYWINCDNIQNCTYIQDTVNSHHCNFSRFLNGCTYCFWCMWLSNKQYYIFNKPYTKELYKKETNELLLKWAEYCINEFKKLQEDLKIDDLFIRHSENVVWNNIVNSKDIYFWYDIFDTHNAKYCTRLNSNSKDCYDVYQSGSPILSYENLTSDTSYHSAFITRCWEWCSNLYYCDNCHACKDCFWCIWLRNKQYCILNKQYSKEEYQQLVSKIIKHMKNTWERWLYFPRSYSTFGYNESLAQEHYPLEKYEVIKKWYNRMDSEYNIDIPKWIKIIEANEVKDLDKKDLLNIAIKCEITWKPFRITKQELDFYKKMWLPIPKRHYNQRHMDRLSQINSKIIRDRKCDKCWVEIHTTYPPKWTESVYCENCYDKEVY